MSLSKFDRLLIQRRLARRQSPGAGLTVTLLALVAVAIGAPLAGLGATAAAAGLAYNSLAEELEVGVARMQNLDERETFETTRIYDRNGALLRMVIGEGKRTYIGLEEVARPLVEATVAVEDASFYTNPGIDADGIARATLGEAGALARQLLMGDVHAVSGAGGGSTITQQFVRHVAFSHEERMARSYRRKAKELVLAIILTRNHDKDDILEWYLNEIYYGNLAYGIEAAAQTYFDKPAKELNLAESAMLAGLPQCPRCYDPLALDPEQRDASKRRQRVVLDLMVEAGLATRAEADRAARARLNFHDPDDGLFLAPHFVVWVEELLENMLGAERLVRGGLEITTSLDLRMQTLGEREVREQIDSLRDRHDVTSGALVAMEPRTGQVLAMVGSADYFNLEIDGKVNVALRERQPGSSIKPITYAAAIERGMSPAAVLWDVPMKLHLPGGVVYEPRNYDEAFRGPVRLRAALANSYNIPALKLLRDIPPVESEDGTWMYGVEQTVEMAHRLGITGLNRPPWDYGLSLTLGGGEVKLLDLTTAFGTLANAGGLVRPHPILSVVDSSGNVLYELGADEDELQPVEAVSPQVAYIVTDFLSDNVARTPAFGSASALQLGAPAAAKTGTTNDFRDNWTVGYTPYLVTGVWAGNADNTPMRNSSGLTGAAPIWNGFMRNLVFDDDLRDEVVEARERFGFDAPRNFVRPGGLVEGRVCELRSLNELGPSCTSWRTELFIADKLPKGVVVAPPDAGESLASDSSNTDGSSRSTADDGWTIAVAAVVPLPPPPQELIDAAAAADEPLRWPTARLCRPEMFGADRAQPVAVVQLPPVEQDWPFIREWASENGWVAVDASEPCTPEMADAALPPGSLLGDGTHFDGPGIPMPATAEYRLNLSPGTTLRVMTPVTGTALFDPSVIEYYKVELGPGAQPSEWITIGDIHSQPVVEGRLEVLDASSLSPGDYVLRLVLVGRDGNFVQPPHAVPFRVDR